MKKIFLFAGIVIFSYHVANSKGNTGGGGGSNPEPCPVEETAYVTLAFANCAYPERSNSFDCALPIPRAACNPSTFTGTPSLPGNPNKWHLKIKVNGNGVAKTCSTYEVVTTPTNASISYAWPVQVPKDKIYSIIVEFYEDVNNCTMSKTGRQKYSYTHAYRQGTQILATLKYDGTF